MLSHLAPIVASFFFTFLNIFTHGNAVLEPDEEGSSFLSLEFFNLEWLSVGDGEFSKKFSRGLSIRIFNLDWGRGAEARELSGKSGHVWEDDLRCSNVRGNITIYKTPSQTQVFAHVDSWQVLTSVRTFSCSIPKSKKKSDCEEKGTPFRFLSLYLKQSKQVSTVVKLRQITGVLSLRLSPSTIYRLGLGDAILKSMEGRQITPCSTCGSSIGLIPDAPPKISLVDSPQRESMARSVVSETEQRIADLEEIKRRSSETHQLILRRLEEYHSYAFYHKSFLAPIRHFPSELLSEIFVICVTGSASDRFSCLSTLKKVCCRWRDIVHTTPRLWNRLPSISADPLLETEPSGLQIYLTLARDLPLSIDVHIHQSCVTVTPMLQTLVTHSDRIGELKIHCEWKALSLLSGMSSRLRNLRTLELTTNNSIEDTDTAIFSISPQLHDVCFMPSMSGYHLSRLILPWTQLKTVTIQWLDLDYAWMILSKAPHMEMCTFIQIANVGNPRGIIRHTGLKGLSFKKVPCNEQTVFPASLSDNLVLPNLNSLLFQLDELTIDPIIALISRSGCRLTKLALNSPWIGSSLSVAGGDSLTYPSGSALPPVCRYQRSYH